MRSFRWLLPLAASLLVACSSEEGPSANDEPTVTATAGIALSASAEPLRSFHYDTGLVPAGSPAQVELSLSAGGGVRVEAHGKVSDKGLEGEAGSGKMTLDLHLKLDGRLKTDATLGGVDGDLPGLEDIDVAIRGETSFDPFLLGKTEVAKLAARIPAGELPEIPLGATPGKLRLSVVEGSVLDATFKGSCMSVAQEKASYAGEVSTSGKLILAGTLAVAIAGFEQKVDLGRIEVPIPALKAGLDFAAKDVKGAKDGANGDACGRKRGAATSSSESASVTPEETPPSPSGPSEPNGGGRCAVDAQESNGPPNDEMAVATSLGPMSDTAEKKDRQKTVSGFVGMDDVDWFVLDVADEGWNGNPHVTVRVLEPNVELALYYDCAAGPSSSTCEKGSPDDALVPLRGCRGSEVTLATSCSGINETGKAFIQVRAQDQACHGYALDVLVE